MREIKCDICGESDLTEKNNNKHFYLDLGQRRKIRFDIFCDVPDLDTHEKCLAKAIKHRLEPEDSCDSFFRGWKENKR